VKGPLSKYRAQPRKIVIERIENAKPVASAVDLEALNGSQTIIGFDEVGIRGGRHSIRFS
jgi:hypothetical protein